MHTYTYIRTYMHAYMHTYIHPCIHTYIKHLMQPTIFYKQCRMLLSMCACSMYACSNACVYACTCMFHFLALLGDVIFFDFDDFMEIEGNEKNEREGAYFSTSSRFF